MQGRKSWIRHCLHATLSHSISLYAHQVLYADLGRRTVDLSCLPVRFSVQLQHGRSAELLPLIECGDNQIVTTDSHASLGRRQLTRDYFLLFPDIGHLRHYTAFKLILLVSLAMKQRLHQLDV